MGQVAMATDHGCQRPALTDGAGSPIGGGPLGSREKVAMGPWTVRPLHEVPQGVGGADERGKDGAPFSCQTAAQSTA